MRAGIARHILDHADDGHVGAAEQVDRAPRVDQRDILRGGDDYRAGGLVLLDHRQLHVAGPRRQIEHQYVGITRSEEHTSELQSLMRISYAVFCLKKKPDKTQTTHKT